MKFKIAAFLSLSQTSEYFLLFLIFSSRKGLLIASLHRNTFHAVMYAISFFLYLPFSVNDS